jgi:hypothetical protein
MMTDGDGAFFIYEIAFKLKWREVAILAVRHFDYIEFPVSLTVEEARQIGVDAYHCLVAAADLANSEDWGDIADNIVLPEE